ncbi:MAG: peptidoglycan-associated lipoprotein Pal [Sphingomonadaceae bacterium]|nr:peptidoglycan-associated lipoprotein Pal [Sphingomonadaceae bacterium]
MRASAMILAASTLALAACGRDAPEDLPPPPPDTTMPTDPTTDPGYGQPAPGSREDFLARVGSDTIYFGLDQHDIDAEDRATLDSQATWLTQYSSVFVTVEGHADERGTREYNLGLGERRANAAKNYLVSRGVDASRITVISYGKERPVALGSDESSWARNRRSVTVVPSSTGF